MLSICRQRDILDDLSRQEQACRAGDKGYAARDLALAQGGGLLLPAGGG